MFTSVVHILELSSLVWIKMFGRINHAYLNISEPMRVIWEDSFQK